MGKVCPKCGKMKAESEFYPRSKGSAYLQSYCKECEKKNSLVEYAERKTRDYGGVLPSGFSEVDPEKALARSAVRRRRSAVIESARDDLIAFSESGARAIAMECTGQIELNKIKRRYESAIERYGINGMVIHQRGKRLVIVKEEHDPCLKR